MKNIFKLTVFLIVLSMLLMSKACVKEDENHHKSIVVINNSEKAIYAYFGFSYPDTSALTTIPSSSVSSIYKVEPHQRNNTALVMRSFWEIVFKDGRRIPSDTVMVFILDGEKVEKYNATKVHVSTAQADDMLLQRYDLSLQDLQKMDFHLSYPPNDAMRNVKMYPAYGKKK